MTFLVLKALHIVAVVAWFAGLFYIVRLFVYLTETHDRPEAERAVLLPLLELMAWRLWYGITWPAGLAAVGFGLALLPTFWPPAAWLQLKLGLVAVLVGYHLGCHWLFVRLHARTPPWSSRSLRIWNEVATVLLVAIVFLVVLKQSLALGWAVGGVVALSAVLMAAITAYRRLRRD